ncbi:MAG: bis(5'-nucleosyl)-tetraphosphatase (symmetrical) YqeK [Fusobacterium sp. JB019]|nr:bis(5'-nucleosyl)-tetraphosphatase (symmetrical) YqeK [Fusobacterium sp. JB020]MDP0506383.1 bis(5'-nucleosyl)-tetraphosphatase (symmetrical) YqeK [Fusobacterium sp. JB019]
MEIEDIRKRVKKKLSDRRYRHTLGVEKMAVILAHKNNYDEKKVRIAALLHDYMKEEKIENLQNICKGIKEVEGYEELTEILHGFAAGEIIGEEFNIEDKEIKEAIKYHTIGREKMSLLDKIIYISDAIEEGRDYPGVDKIREEAMENIDKGIIEEVKRKIEFLKGKDGKIHQNTLKMLRFLEKGR